jgi:SPP1 family predicted phage head-tail adaptor
MFLTAGELTSKVTIEESTATNIDGVATETWSTVQASVPAKITARESMTVRQAAQVKAETSHLVTMRYRDDITSRCRLTIGTRVLNILGPPRRAPETRPVALVMECLEVES